MWEISPKLAKLEALATEFETAKRELIVALSLGLYNETGVLYIINRYATMYWVSRKILDTLSKERYGKADSVVKGYYHDNYRPDSWDINSCYFFLKTYWFTMLGNREKVLKKYEGKVEAFDGMFGELRFIPIGKLKEVYGEQGK